MGHPIFGIAAQYRDPVRHIPFKYIINGLYPKLFMDYFHYLDYFHNFEWNISNITLLIHKL